MKPCEGKNTEKALELTVVIPKENIFKKVSYVYRLSQFLVDSIKVLISFFHF